MPLMSPRSSAPVTVPPPMPPPPMPPPPSWPAPPPSPVLPFPAGDGGEVATIVDQSQVDEWGGPTWVDAAAPPPPGAVTALDLWDQLFHGYFAVRNAGASASGEAYPETTAGDVRRIALQLSRALCLPRYDGASLQPTRAAWRDACARIDTLTRDRPWSDLYPENERFWLSDALALCQRLAEIDRRRNRLRDGLDLETYLGDRSDPLTTWQDLRAFFLSRRIVRRDEEGERYPETTVGDVIQVVRVFRADADRVWRALPPAGEARAIVAGPIEAWRQAAGTVDGHAARLPSTATYPENAAFWRATRKLALWLSTGADVAGGRR